MQPGTWPVSRRVSRQRKPSSAQLSDDELRKRIFANTAVLFPSSHSSHEGHPYEIVYASKPRDNSDDDNPWQYAMVVRRDSSGGYTPLIKGQAWSTSVPWQMVLQGLLDTTATLIHKTVGQAQMPRLGVLEELPQYTPGPGRIA